MTTFELMELTAVVKAALTNARSLERCHSRWSEKRRRDGLSRASVTTYQARASNLAMHSKSTNQELKAVAGRVLGFDFQMEGYQQEIERLNAQVQQLKAKLKQAQSGPTQHTEHLKQGAGHAVHENTLG